MTFLTCILGSFLKKNSKIYWNEMNLVSFSFGSMLVVRHPMVIILLFWDVSSEIKKKYSVCSEWCRVKTLDFCYQEIINDMVNELCVCLFLLFSWSHQFYLFLQIGWYWSTWSSFYYFGSNYPWLPCVYIDNFVKNLLIVIALC